MKNKFLKVISVLLVLTTLSCFSLPAFAASKNQALKTASYNEWTGKSTYIKNTFNNVPNNKWITIKTGWGNSFKAVTSYNTNGLKSYADKIRFDVHIIDTSTNRVVKYYYSLKPGARVKVFSEVPSIKANKYKVTVTSYFYDYKTFKGNANVGWQYGMVASNLKYKITY